MECYHAMPLVTEHVWRLEDFRGLFTAPNLLKQGLSCYIHHCTAYSGQLEMKLLDNSLVSPSNLTVGILGLQMYTTHIAFKVGSGD